MSLALHSSSAVCFIPYFLSVCNLWLLQSSSSIYSYKHTNTVIWLTFITSAIAGGVMFRFVFLCVMFLRIITQRVDFREFCWGRSCTRGWLIEFYKVRERLGLAHRLLSSNDTGRSMQCCLSREFSCYHVVTGVL